MGVKTAVVFLRIAAATALFAGVAHTARFLTYVPTHGAAEAAVVDSMKSHLFSFGGGAPHSYWDMYLGYGLFVTVGSFSEAILFWLLSNFATVCTALVRAVAAIFVLAEVGYAALILKYFFPLPLYVHVAVAVCLCIVFMASAPRAMRT